MAFREEVSYLLSCIHMGSSPVRRQLLGWRSGKRRVYCARGRCFDSPFGRKVFAAFCVTKNVGFRFVQLLDDMKTYRLT